MAKEPSFDVVSEVDMQEVSNAVNQTVKEITQRFDFKGSKSTVEIENGNAIQDRDRGRHPDAEYRGYSAEQVY